MPGTIRLTILHTNDIHGRVHQLSRISTLVRQVRQEVSDHGGYCLYLDGGDAEDTTLVESVLTRGGVMNTLLRTASCDQVALGNAVPIRYGPQAVANLETYFGKPLLCANLFTAEGNLIPGVAPSYTYTLEDLSLCVIGFTSTMREFYTNYFKFPARQPHEILPALLEQARSEGVKTVLVLSHTGSNHDCELAEQVPGVDIIVGGHDHKRISPPIVVNNTLIVESGEYGQWLGRLDLVIDSSTGKVLESTPALLPVSDDIPEDEKILSALSVENEEIDRIMRLEIGETLVPITASEDSECAAGNLQADAVLEHVKGAQASFILTGHWVNGIDQGRITQGQLYSANRSAGNPALVILTGAQIRRWLVAALTPGNIEKKIHPLRGKRVGFPGTAGLKVIADQAHLEDMRIWIGGEELIDNATYRIAVTDLEISEILNYLPIPDNQAQYEVPIILPEIIEEYIRRHSPIRSIDMGRIVIN